MKTLSNPNSKAFLDCYLIEGKENLPCVIICPGGGYMHVSAREGKPVAEAFNRKGYNAFVLNYTVEPWPLELKPLMDLAWAISFLRENHKQYLIDPNDITICGFSAGGHLAASLGVFWHNPKFFCGEKPAEIYMPNQLVLAYPVISAKTFAHQESIRNLSGENMSEIFSLDERVTENTPRTFLWHTSDDKVVPVENSILFASSLSKYKIPFELHIYPKGEHGLSLATDEVAEKGKSRYPNKHIAGWFDLCIDWLSDIK